MGDSLPLLPGHPYAAFLDAVEKPARYAGGEVGSVVKDWSSVEATFCLAFPDVYDIGMSHLGFKILYRILNDDPRTLAERCYAPWVDMEAEIRARGLPLVSLESARPLRDFDVVGFSLQFELTYTNVLAMLDLGGIPLRTAERGESDPLVVAGGPTATHPEPLAPFIDAFVIGDGEEKATEIALAWTRLRKEGVPRAERLVRLAELGGVYVPSLYETAVDPDTGLEVVTRSLHPSAPLPIRRALVDINRYPFPDESPTGGPEAIFDRLSIEIARGCTEGCRFCQAGMIYRPVRERDPEQIVETVLSAVRKSGHDEVSLTALSTADVSCISPLVKKVAGRLAEERISLGVSSLRAYGLEPDLLDEIKRVRATGLTFAPEAGTQRMRDVVNKNVTEEQLLETAERVTTRGWGRMKLYFMIGLPTETDDDVRGIVETGARAAAVGRRVARERAAEPGGKRIPPPEVTVSVSTHVPKPHTPFQWAAMDGLAEVARKQRLLQEAVRPHRNVKLKTHGAAASVLEGIFARGDRRLAGVLERAYRNGARFDSWDDRLRLDVWEEAFEALGVDRARYLGTIPITARLPWDHVDVGLEDGFLAREYRKALQSRLSPPCGKVAGTFVHHTNVEDAKADTRRLVCYDCGVACDLTQMRAERITFLEKLDARKRLPLAPAPIPGEGDHHGDTEGTEGVGGMPRAPQSTSVSPEPVVVRNTHVEAAGTEARRTEAREGDADGAERMGRSPGAPHSTSASSIAVNGTQLEASGPEARRTEGRDGDADGAERVGRSPGAPDSTSVSSVAVNSTQLEASGTEARCTEARSGTERSNGADRRAASLQEAAIARPLVQGAGAARAPRYRFRFEKTGAMALLGHLDVIRELPRVLRRVGVPMAYSAGFHPKPDMAFAPALSLGVPSLDEYADIRLAAELSQAELDALLERMNRSAPAGLAFRGAARLGDDDPAVTKVIAGARYAIAFARAAAGGAAAEDLLGARCRAALEAAALPYRREIDGLAKRMDLRPYLLRATVAGPDALAAVRAAGIGGELVALDVDVAITPAGAVKASEIAMVIAGDGREVPPHRAVRVALFALVGDERVGPLDLARLRRPRSGATLGAMPA